MIIRRLLAVGAAVSALFAAPAHALVIIPTYDSSITSAGNAATVENAIGVAIAAFQSLYADPGTVGIYFATAGIGGGQSDTGIYTTSYATYKSALQNDAAANPLNTVLATALNHLSSGNDANGSRAIAATSALLRVALGYPAVSPCYSATGAFVNTCNAPNDGVVTISNSLSYSGQTTTQNSRAVTVLEHEIDEVLGGGGTGSTLNDVAVGDSRAGDTGPMDLYRYKSSTTGSCGGITGTPSFTTSSAETACYSIDGGSTALVQMNQSGTGDFGDYTGTNDIQNFSVPGGPVSAYTTISPEYVMMDSIGWDPIPEPGSLLLLIGGVGGLGFIRSRAGRAAGPGSALLHH